MIAIYGFKFMVLAAIIASAFLTEENLCSKTLEELTKLDPCPVNGIWTPWSSWQACPTTCGPGLARRNRTCSNPKPSILGRACLGDENDYKMCINDNPCPINGFWSNWSHWNCYIYGGKRVRERTCYGPLFGGIDCVGNKTQFKSDVSCT